MACHTPPLKEAKKQGEMPLPSVGLIPFKNLGDGWDRGWVMAVEYDRPSQNPFYFSEKIFCYLFGVL